jgi:uncharacterized protein involved in response to NO
MSDVPLSEMPRAQFALWNLGFRPLYLAAGGFAALAIALWTAQVAGWISVSYLSHPYWHAHEMIFGYALAVIAGFLFTAVRNWTGLPTPEGGRLAAIVALWLAGRLFAATPWTLLSLAADLGFAIAIAVGIGVPLVRSKNTRNLFFLLLIAILGCANIAFHLAMRGDLALPVRDMLQLALNVIAFIMALMAGRVVPMFTSNGVPGTKPLRFRWLEIFSMASLVVLAVADLLQPAPAIIIVVAAAASLAHAWRLALWQPLRTLQVPLVWVLHCAYAWLVAYLALRALSAGGWIASGIAVHALTVGALGGLTLGMMTRTARGHTGRPLRAGPAEIVCYVLINLAALARVAVPLALPSLQREAIVLSGGLWVGAFALFAVNYWPILTRSRADGRPG